MTTYAILTVGYNDFLLPAKEAQACFEALSGRACSLDFIGTEDAMAAGTTRGDALRNETTRVQCKLMTVDAMHDALDRGKACDAHAEARREMQRQATLAA